MGGGGSAEHDRSDAGDGAEPHHHEPEIAVEALGIEEPVVAPWPEMVGANARRWRRRTGTGAPDGTRGGRSDVSPWTVLWVALFGQFTVGFTITLLTITLPRIAKDMNTPEANLAWLITGPILAFGVMGPALGKAGDLFGHKRLFLGSLFGAGVFAALTAMSWSAGSLIAFRIIGAGIGAAVGPAANAMLNHVFPPEQRVKSLGYVSSVGAGAPVLGAIALAPVVDAFGWRWIFAVQAPMCVAAMLLAWLKLPETRRMERSRFDVPGAVLLGGSITIALFALNRGKPWGWTHPVVIGGFVLGPVLMAIFISVERRADSPLLPLHYFRRRNFAAPIANQFLLNVGYLGAFALTPLLLQQGLGYSTTHTTLLSISRPIVFAIAGPMAGYLAQRIGERGSAMWGAGLVVLSLIGLSLIQIGTPDWWTSMSLGLSGFGFGMSSPAMAAAVANSVDDGDFGIAAATQQLLSQVGGAIGVQIMQTVQAAGGATTDVASYRAAYLTGAACSGCGVLAGLMVRSTSSRRAAPARP